MNFKQFKRVKKKRVRYFASCFGQKRVFSINYGEITGGTHTVRETVKRPQLHFLWGISLWYWDHFLGDLQCGKKQRRERQLRLSIRWIFRVTNNSAFEIKLGKQQTLSQLALVSSPPAFFTTHTSVAKTRMFAPGIRISTITLIFGTTLNYPANREEAFEVMEILWSFAVHFF